MQNCESDIHNCDLGCLLQDRRKEMTKSVAKLAEDGKVSIRYATLPVCMAKGTISFKHMAWQLSLPHMPVLVLSEHLQQDAVWLQKCSTGVHEAT